jgi:hypothetical protein
MGENSSQDAGHPGGVDRFTIQEAARHLGVSEGAIRKRVNRGTLEHDKDPDGRVYVYLNTGGRQGVDVGQDEGVYPHNDARISDLLDQVAYLREENRRKDEIIMQQAMTMRELAAPSEPAQEEPTGAQESAPESEEEGAEWRTETQSAEAQRRVPWWRRLFGKD